MRQGVPFHASWLFIMRSWGILLRLDDALVEVLEENLKCTEKERMTYPSQRICTASSASVSSDSTHASKAC